MSIDWTSFVTACEHGGIRVEQNRSMALNTTYGVGGVAACVITVSSRRDLQIAADLIAAHKIANVVVVGRGSNLLISDSGFDGLIVLISYSSETDVIEVVGDDVIAPGSMPMPILARRSVAAGRAGLEWCVGIPGSVGGAVRMNAGGHGSEIVDDLVSVELVSLRSGRRASVDVIDLGMHFRGSALAPHHVVVSARFRTSEVSGDRSLRAIDEVVAWRRQHQPGGRNAGSVFVNPSPGDGSSGALIDACGLRGYAVGGARVSEKHANFIQASDGATASDIVAVMQHVQNVVEKEKGIRLRSEVCLVGFSSEIQDSFADPRHNDVMRIVNSERLAELMGESP